MADVKLNPVFESFRGKVGDLVFKKLYGETIVSRSPDTKNRIPTDAQKAHQERFRQAAIYGKTVMADAQAKAAYELAAKNKQQPLFSLMVEDYFTPPEVSEIDLSLYTGQSGNTIDIRVNDDFKVTAVDVAIKDAAGDTFEHGAAVKSATDPTRWIYTATTSVPAGTQIRVEVNAKDRPGHTGTKIANA